MSKGLSKEQRKELRDKIKILKGEIKKAKEIPKFDKNNDTIIEWLENYKKEKGSYYTPYALRMVRFCVSHGIGECTRVKANGEKKKAEKRGEKKRGGRPKLSEECKKELKEEREYLRRIVKSKWITKNYNYYIFTAIDSEDAEARQPRYLKANIRENENGLEVLCGEPTEIIPFGINSERDLEKYLYGFTDQYGVFFPSLYNMARFIFIFDSEGKTLRGLRQVARLIGSDIKIPKRKVRGGYD